MRLYTGIVLCALAAPCFCQVLVEHSAAAAGGSVGALAGKAVSQGLGSTLTTVKKATDQPAKAVKNTSIAKKKEVADGDASRSKPLIAPAPPSYPELGPATASVGMPASSGGVTRQNRAARPIAPANVGEAGSAPVVAPIPPPIVHRASREEVAAILPGASRSDVIAKLGPPASLVTIPDEGHMLETFKYVSGNSWIGTVRIDNGSVVKVDSPQQQ